MVIVSCFLFNMHSDDWNSSACLTSILTTKILNLDLISTAATQAYKLQYTANATRVCVSVLSG